jgi:glutaconate CoA-transferase subunit A
MASAVIDKRTSLEKAVSLVHDGDVLALGGMTIYRRPMAFVRQMLRSESPPHDLTLLCFTAGVESDLLVGSGLVSRVRSCYFGLESFGLAPMFTSLANAGRIDVIEETESSLAFGMRATMAGVSFMPGPGWVGTDLPRVRPDVKFIDDPYGPGQYAAFPAVHCDVAVIHALRADSAGNAEFGPNQGVDAELGLLSRRVIVTTEEVVERIEGPIDVSSLKVTAVVHAPGGAWPTSCYPLYPLDGQEILRYSESCPDGFAEYVATFLAKTPPSVQPRCNCSTAS